MKVAEGFMLVKLESVYFSGLSVKKVTVEVNLSSRGLPTFDIVGLGGRSVEESRHRIKAAIQNSGYSFPEKKITVNLAPADVVKEGTFYDLPICMGILSADLGFETPEKSLFFGELSLNGEIKYSRGTFLTAVYAKENNYKRIYVSKEGVGEVMEIADGPVECYPADNISELVQSFLGKVRLIALSSSDNTMTADLHCAEAVNFASMVGQDQVKRALTICAAGGHNLIMVGPPGSGKSMAAAALAEVLPPLTGAESAEVTKIYSLFGEVPKGAPMVRERPFRQPHHTASYAGIIGGGNNPAPGEITLAHNGILFLDELSEFNRNVLEALRQPMEKGSITLSRSRGTVTFPASFTLVAASNPCPCGYYGDPFHECRCPPNRIEQYRRKLSGPIMDRIDIHLLVKPVQNGSVQKFLMDTSTALARKNEAEKVRESIFRAREIQTKRFTGESIFVNSRMSNRLLLKHANMVQDAKRVLNMAMEKMHFSARTYFKLIKVARTISDLEQKVEIEKNHILEAIQYRECT